MIRAFLPLFIIAITSCKIISFNNIIPKKSPSDPRRYEIYTLENQMKVFLIQDPKIKKSAFSISVNVGSRNNPKQFQGLAHLIEHMLFLGSKNYPLQSQFIGFVNLNSGQRNGATSYDCTSYHLQVKNDALIQAVQRVVDFIINPLMRKTSLKAAISAINNQYSIRVASEDRRRLHVLRELASPPFSYFSTGNNKTLIQEQVYQDMIDFYNKYYSSNIMAVAIITNESIQQTLTRIQPLLQQIPNKNVVLPQEGEHFTAQQKNRKMVNIESLADQEVLVVNWIVPSMDEFFRQRVSDYIQYLFKYKRKGSLIQVLKNKKYANDLQMQYDEYPSQSIITLILKLTPEGYQNYQKIYNIISDFVQSHLQAKQEIYNEIINVNKIIFQYKEAANPYNQVRRFSQRMHINKVPLQNIINYPIQNQDFEKSKQVIDSFLAQMSEQNCIIFLCSKKQLKNPILQRIMGVKYKLGNFPQRASSQIQFNEFQLNPYLPLNQKVQDVRQYLYKVSEIQSSFYYNLNNQFKVPKMGLEIRIYSQADQQFLQLYAYYLEDLFTYIRGSAEQLETQITFKTNDCLAIIIFGFTDAVLKLLTTISKYVCKQRRGQIDDNSFKRALDKIKLQYKNYYVQNSGSAPGYILKILSIQTLKLPQQKLQSISLITLDEFQERVQKLWNNNLVKAVVVGNFNPNIVNSINSYIIKQFQRNQQDIMVPTLRPLKLNKNITFLKYLSEPQITLSTSVVYYQAGPYSDRLFYLLSMLENFADQPFFNQMRNVKKIAYRASVLVLNIRGVLGIRFLCSSNSNNPKQIQKQIKKFIFEFFGKMDQILSKQNAKKFSVLKNSLFGQINNPFNNLKALFQFISSQITKKTFYFNRKEQQEINSYLNSFQIQDLQDLWKNISTKSIDVHFVAQNHAESYQQQKYYTGQIFRDINQLKNNAIYWQDGQYCCN